MSFYKYGTVISKVVPVSGNNVSESNILRGTIEITHHQDQIFVISSKSPVSEEHIPEEEIFLSMETYVNLSSLSEELQVKVREELKAYREKA